MECEFRQTNESCLHKVSNLEIELENCKLELNDK